MCPPQKFLGKILSSKVTVIGGREVIGHGNEGLISETSAPTKETPERPLPLLSC